MSENKRTCNTCEEIKPLSEFYRAKGCKGGMRPRCKVCCRIGPSAQKRIEHHRAWDRLYNKTHREQIRNTQLIRKYGITLDDYNLMLENQEHRCKICGSTDPADRSGRLVVDHCHTTTRVRGLLCHKCNSALGLFKDDRAIIRSALNYLNDSAETTKNDL